MLRQNEKIETVAYSPHSSYSSRDRGKGEIVRLEVDQCSTKLRWLCHPFLGNALSF
ncbi:hypothetical protein DA100_03595 [Vibrio sp. Hep-1b-8]|nr:hypothetical protein DA100_03595 [Vibrio sp. Hep-1b-8]